MKTDAVREAASCVLNAGRGLFAVDSIRAGAVLLRERPFLSGLRSPARSPELCPVCWAASTAACRCALETSNNYKLAARARARLAASPTFTALRDAQMRRLHTPPAAARVGGAVNNRTSGAFAIMVTDLVGMCLTDLLSSGTLRNSGDKMDSLVTARNQFFGELTYPEEWIRDYKEIKDAMLGGKGLSDVFSLKWYAAQIMRLNLNAFECHFIASNSEPVKGSCVYLTASLLNHSCVPNVTVDWNGSNEIELKANVDLEPGSELFISYIGPVDPASDDSGNRQQFLRYNYGFTCSCPLCCP
ncbi:hypothetical protein HDU84_005010 [Entophlyctis sp. JEL0112]|nr:hypothetical protein HDU84_005010 [Entophlyctis sp. JEL0112]